MTRLPVIAPALLALLLLAGCGGRQAATPTMPEDDPNIIACRAEARSHPISRDIRGQLVTATPVARARIEAELADAEQRTYNQCLRDRGVLRGGGVEAVRR